MKIISFHHTQAIQSWRLWLVYLIPFFCTWALENKKQKNISKHGHQLDFDQTVTKGFSRGLDFHKQLKMEDTGAYRSYCDTA